MTRKSSGAILPRGMPAMILIAAFACIGLGGCASSAITQINEDTVSSPQVRLTITKPHDWRFVDFGEARARRKNLRAKNQTVNFIAYNRVYNWAVVMTNGDRSSSHWSLPEISVGTYPLGDDRFASSSKVAGFLIYGYGNVLSGVRTVQGPSSAMVGGVGVACCRIRYPLKYEDGAVVEVEQCFWVKAAPFSATVISAAFDVRDRTAAESAITQVLSSVKFAE